MGVREDVRLQNSTIRTGAGIVERVDDDCKKRQKLV